MVRICLRHTRVTYPYLLLGEEQPLCVGCDAPITVRHFLLKCGDFSQKRYKYYQVDNMKQLFQDVYVDHIKMFLKNINLFNTMQLCK